MDMALESPKSTYMYTSLCPSAFHKEDKGAFVYIHATPLYKLTVDCNSTISIVMISPFFSKKYTLRWEVLNLNSHGHIYFNELVFPYLHDR